MLELLLTDEGLDVHVKAGRGDAVGALGGPLTLLKQLPQEREEEERGREREKERGKNERTFWYMTGEVPALASRGERE